jgi:predicted molibdopterin-dependent oxidoreductase YjgC
VTAVLTTCPFCACGCGVYLYKEEGKLIGVAPSETHAVSRGKLCARGWSAHEASLWGERLTVPLIRRDGSLKPASWSEAMSFVVSRFSDLIKAGEQIGVLGSPRATNEENYLAGKLARQALGTNHIDLSARADYAPIFKGISQVVGAAPPMATIEDIAASDLILLIEGDLARNHPRAAVSVMEAIKRGAALVTLGPVKTQMSRLAKLSLISRSGSVSEEINKLLAAIAGLDVNELTLAYRCKGWDAIRQKASSITVSEEIRGIAEHVSKAKRPVFLLSAIAASPEQLVEDSAAVASLAAVSGYLDRPSFGFMVLAERSNLFGAWQMGAALSPFPGFELPPRDEKKRLSIRPSSPAPDSRPGLDAAAMMAAVKGLVVVADDPATVLRAGAASTAAMKEMSCVVVLDSYNTSTAQIAHVVLPIAGFAESEGTYTNMEGRVQRVRAAAEPPGEGRQGWQVLAELLNRFGTQAPYRTAGAVFQEIAQTFPAYAATSYEALDAGKGHRALVAPVKHETNVQMAQAKALVTNGYPKLLIQSGAFDWSRDPLVSFSPTLCRDFDAKRKQYPDGLVEMAKSDADELGVKQGWKVKLSSALGEAALAVSLRTDLASGVVLLPFAFRDFAFRVTGGQTAVAIKVDRA